MEWQFSFKKEGGGVVKIGFKGADDGGGMGKLGKRNVFSFLADEGKIVGGANDGEGWVFRKTFPYFSVDFRSLGAKFNEARKNSNFMAGFLAAQFIKGGQDAFRGAIFKV